MNEGTRYLLLWLEGPLQAWGHDSKFGVRDTLTFPSRSGILGLLCCARGAGGAETEWLARMQPMIMEVRAYTRVNAQDEASLREPPLRDFHMVGSGYDDSDPWQNLMIPKTAEGKKPNGAGTKMTYRYYLQDAAFAVVLEVPDEQTQPLSEALQHPVWDLYLGRKNCVPTELIFQGVFDTAESAWQHAEVMAKDKQRVASFAVLEGDGDGEVITLNDVPVQFGQQKRYRDRRVRIQELG